MGNGISRVFAPMGRMISKACTAASRFWTGNTIKEDATVEAHSSNLSTKLKNNHKIWAYFLDDRELQQIEIHLTDEEFEFLQNDESIIIDKISSRAAYVSFNPNLLKYIKEYEDANNQNNVVFVLDETKKKFLAESNSSFLYMNGHLIEKYNYSPLTYLDKKKGRKMKFSYLTYDKKIVVYIIQNRDDKIENLVYCKNFEDSDSLKNLNIYEILREEQLKIKPFGGKRRRHSKINTFKKLRKISETSRKRQI